MGPIDLFFHLIGFAAPAVAVGILVALGARLVTPAAAQRWWIQAALNAGVGVLALAAGLWYYGVDGKMATYAALVIAIAGCQWAGSRAWRG